MPTMEGSVCTAAPVPDRTLPKVWRGRGVRAGKIGSISAEGRAEQKGVRELLTQSRELLKQMQVG